jgi:hypothetical protein
MVELYLISLSLSLSYVFKVCGLISSQGYIYLYLIQQYYGHLQDSFREGADFHGPATKFAWELIFKHLSLLS